MLKRATYKIKGMSRDLAATSFNSQYAFENRNMRIMTTTQENTLLSLINEKGTLDAGLDITGFPIGQAVMNDEIVLFTTSRVSDDNNISAKEENIATISAEESTINDIEDYDRIYKIWIEDKLVKQSLLYSGNLNFSYKNPIEALSLYENEKLKKVYWVDGLNQPRVINIANSYIGKENDSFDFMRKVSIPTVTITKSDSGGVFPSGTIQYAFSYYNRYGQESPIVYTSPIYYLNNGDRGASPEDTVSTSFKIIISFPDSSFEYIRVYSIIRTSINSTPEVKLITELSTSSDSITYVDNNTKGDSIDPTELLYIGGEPIVAGTICQKDNTLFLGDITLNSNTLESIKESARTLEVTEITQYPPSPTSNSVFYPYKNQLSYGYIIKGFKCREWYRLGFRAIHKTGKKSEVIWITDHYNQSHPVHSSSSGMFSIPKFKVTLPSELVIQLVNMGYIAVEPMVVFPSESERECVCQGLVCPTVFNTIDRYNNSPFAQSSWFTRPFLPENIGTSISDNFNNDKHVEKGAWYEFRHFKALPPSYSRNAEIQCNDDTVASDPYYSASAGYDTINDFVQSKRNHYFVDHNIVTFHSPEIELGEITSLDSNLSFRIVGLTMLTSTASDVDITTSTPKVNENTIGFFKPYILNTGKPYSSRALAAYPMWIDAVGNPVDTPLIPDMFNYFTAFMIYPWQRTGSLTNYQTLKEGATVKPAMLKNKRMSNIRVFSYNTFLDNVWEPSNGITNAEVFNSNEVSNVRISAPSNSGLQDLNYYGNVDKILTPSDARGYMIYNLEVLKKLSNESAYYNINEYLSGEITDLYKDASESYSDDTRSTDPISIKYKSSPHAVFAFNYKGTGNAVILPSLSGLGYSSEGSNPFWANGTSYSASPDIVGDSSLCNGFPFMFIGELYRSNVSNRFGGTTDEAIESNIWEPAGRVVRLGSSDATLYFTEGDTYYQRFDSLRTYAFTEDDYNSIVDIASFMCETRINIDGRYDRNRGMTNNLSVSPTNFNLWNPAYSQSNNFFTGRALNYKKLNLNTFKNTITWSKTKSLGEQVDNWTNITLASTLNLDGDKGQVRAIRRFNNDLIAFQDKGISTILYNESMQLTTNNGVPIEIANSGKVSGKRYITDKIGCRNKWSICETPSGIYFIDDITKGIYLFNGKLDNLSDRLGFHSWINTNSKSTSIWNPKDFKGFVSYYDKVNGDVFFISEDDCLAYSEPLGEFTSFYSYEHTPYFSNISDRGLFFKSTDSNNTRIWLHNEGDYNYYFGNYKPFSTTIIANPDALNDKTFCNVEFRADTWNSNTLLKTSFDNLETWNEYQEGVSKLVTKLGVPSNLKRKFRIWRANIPRDKSNNRDRMRNPWLYIKMEMKNPNTYKTLLQDLTVSYL